jgi:FKBP-type peptidyl-prolyl cis-trans isomerase SlyD
VSERPVGRDTVVSVSIELFDAQGVPLHASERPLAYLHGGHGALLEGLERALEGKRAGEVVLVQLEPDQAFGDYDPALVRLEDAARYGNGLQVGMEVEDAFDEGEPRMYRVTDLAAGKAVLDANHPFAGLALRFRCTIVAVRRASAEEIRSGKPGAP